jgi:hypothetical protein
MTGSAKQSMVAPRQMMDCFVALLLALTLFELPLRQEADHGVGKGVRLFDIGNMRGVEDR